MRFNTIGVSDGISMGTEGMSYSLQSRDLIADSIETVMGAQWYDANISIPGCDKNMPGCLMAMGRLNRPSLMVYGGTIKPGIASTAQKARHRLGLPMLRRVPGRQASTKTSAQEIVRHSCPGAGACGGMYTANTMASAIEAMGMSLPYSSSIPAEDPAKLDECLRAGAAIRMLLERDIKPRDIMTRAAFENAMVVVMALGGSTNAVLHLIAMARAVDVPLTIDDFQRVSDRVPFLADLKPSGKYVQEDLHNVGGTPAVMKYLLEKGLLDGDCLTVTGKTLAENLARPAGPRSRARRRSSARKPDQADRPHPDSAAATWRPRAPWPRSPARKAMRFTGPAKVYDSRRRHAARPGAQGDRQGRRGDHSLRRPQGRARHARDADADLGHHGRRPGQGRGPDHRRPLLRRLARLHRRPRHARGPGRRPDRAWCKTATGSRSTPSKNEISVDV